MTAPGFTAQHEPVAATAPPSPAPAAVRVRYLGIDIARFAAIIGMFAAHLIGVAQWAAGVPELDTIAGKVEEVTASGNAAVLFAVLGGVSTVFATRRALREGRVGSAIAATAVRGAVLLGMGFLLSLLISPIVVVLAYYGAAMLIIAPLVAAPIWILASLASAIALLSGLINAGVRSALGVAIEGRLLPYEGFFADPLAAVRTLLLTGMYPAVTWVAYLCVGIIIARILTGAAARGSRALARAAALIAGIGAVTTIAAHITSEVFFANVSSFTITDLSPEQLSAAVEELRKSGAGAPRGANFFQSMIATPHTGSFMEMVSATGLALAAIGLLVWVFDARRSTPLGFLLGAARAAGAAPLTIYAAHFVATTLLLGRGAVEMELLSGPPQPWWVLGTWAWVLQVGLVLAFGALLARLGRRGPLEALLSAIVRWIVPPVRRGGRDTWSERNQRGEPAPDPIQHANRNADHDQDQNSDQDPLPAPAP